MRRISSLFVFALLVTFPILAGDSPYQWVLNMMSGNKDMRSESAMKLSKLNDPAYAPAMVDFLFYTPRSFRSDVVQVLKKLTGQNAGENYYDWVEYIGKRSDLRSPPGYISFKVTLLSLIDPSYKKILSGVPLKIRPEEIVWGGVGRDGIPPIDEVNLISALQAKLKGNEKVFGIRMNGESRAYPLRYLSWHEMLNDKIGGDPITVSY